VLIIFIGYPNSLNVCIVYRTFMGSLFSIDSLFVCGKNDALEEDLHDLKKVMEHNKDRIKDNENKLIRLENKLNNQLNRISDKIEMKISIIDNKVDSLLVLIRK
jgi:hypothetical protein